MADFMAQLMQAHQAMLAKSAQEKESGGGMFSPEGMLKMATMLGGLGGLGGEAGAVPEGAMSVMGEGGPMSTTAALQGLPSGQPIGTIPAGGTGGTFNAQDFLTKLKGLGGVGGMSLPFR